MAEKCDMEDKPLVSIVIPCYNAEDYIAGAIESGLGQSYERIELLVVDDGSTDRSADIVKSFGDKVKLIQRKNSGACAARNVGIEHATGTYIQFLDADDVLYEDKVVSHFVAMRSDCLQGGVMSVCGYDVEWPDYKEVAIPSRSDWGDPFCGVIRAMPQTSAVLYPKSWLVGIGGFNENLSAAQEFDLNLRLTQRYEPKVILIKKSLFCVKKVPGGISRSFERVLGNYPKVMRGVVPRLLEDSGNMGSERRASLAGCLGRAVYACYKRHLCQVGNELWGMAVELDKMAARNALPGSMRMLAFWLGVRNAGRLASVVHRIVRPFRKSA